MIANPQKIEEFQDNVRMELEPICTYSDAYNTLLRIKDDAKKELGASDQETAELMEAHFGNCAEIDDALEEIFPAQFEGR